MTDPTTPSALLWMAALVGMLFLPFLMAMVTSFAKLIIVAGVLRQALGTPQIPPTSVLTGLALVFTLFIMAPVARDAHRQMCDEQTGEVELERIAPAVTGALRTFMAAHTREADYETLRGLRAETDAAPPDTAVTATGQLDELLEFLTLDTPAFVLSQLTEAFQIGFLLYVPFVVIDLVVSNLLLAMGMHMLAPTTVSLPLKLLLFVVVDGWQLVLTGLVKSYVPG